MKSNSNPRNLVAVHLYNDHSGSPLIFAQWLQHAVGQGSNVEIHTSNTNGKLDTVEGAKRVGFNYRPGRQKWITLFRFFWIQCLLFVRMLRTEREGTVVYVNTILPFGAILGAKLVGIKVVCHVHEVSVRPRILNAFLCRAAKRWADKLIFVSDFVAQESGMQRTDTATIPNALSPTFQSGIILKPKRLAEQPFRVLMLASPRGYKGIFQFVELATRMSETCFELVLNGSEEDIAVCFSGTTLPANLQIWPVQSNVHPFYQRADLVLNLSLPDQWMETFGMTALEAMAYGIPVIVPPVGGISEIVEHGISGFHIDPYAIEELSQRIEWFQTHVHQYGEISKAALQRSQAYSYEKFAREIDQVVGSLAIEAIPTLGQRARTGIS